MGQGRMINQQTMNKIVLNYLVFEGYKDTSEQFAQHIGIDFDGPELDTFTRVAYQSIEFRNEIKLNLLNGSIEKVIDLLNLRKPDLLETNNYLYFKILLLNLIEMIKANQNSNGDNEDFVMDIIKFAKSKLINKVIKNSKFMEELELTMTLLLYSKNKDDMPKKLHELFEYKFKNDVADLINKSILVDELRLDDGGVFEGELDEDEEDFKESEEDENVELEERNDERGGNQEEEEEEEEKEEGRDEEEVNHLDKFLLDSDLKKMVKLWIWAENKVNDKNIAFKLE
ncbi:hypothetical protein WICMUC_001077 [Wickerhamomyces mucosus]|uniref:CTLH domain-containing protein n=1 Tax=Wickerhamomyces mucosus TaxID=1378264 RepID=A0A9P8PVR9_9ASCO|nr:hypothetical protein WICMUC_001077 [Wickerhamomyces mucosus]